MLGNLWRLTPLLAVLAAYTSPATAQTPAPARIDAVFAAYDKPDSPGCALGVYQNGRTVYQRGYGMADLQAKTPITPGTVFDIGSTSKQFTAASIALLAQQGKLALDDDVRRYLPELPQYDEPITIRHLLHHTSGLRDYIGVMTWGGAQIEQHTTARQALDAIVRQKALNFTPGEEHLYSNSGYFLLSQIVERVSGRTLRAFAEQNIFRPLGMKHTHFHDDHTMIVPNRAIGYAPGATGFDVAMSKWEQTGDGAVYTTVEDLLHWDRNFYQPKVGGPALLTALHTRGVLDRGDTLNYALGLVHEDFRGVRAVSHSGAWAGYRADLIRFRDQRLSVAVLCNLATANPSQLARAVAALYLGDHLKPAAAPTAATPTRITVAREALATWVGSYRNPVTGTPIEVVLDGEKLMARYGSQRFEMVPTGEAEFTVTITGGPVLRLLPERAVGGGRRIRQFMNGREAAVFEEIRFAEPAPAGTLQRFAGSYFSDELQTTFTVSVDSAGLALNGPSGRQLKLRRLANGDFVDGSWTVRFITDQPNEVSGFSLSAGRVRGIRFVRK